MRTLLVAVSACTLLACGGEDHMSGSGAALSPSVPASGRDGSAMSMGCPMMGGGMTMGGDSGGTMGGGMMGGSGGTTGAPPDGAVAVGDSCTTETSCPSGGSGTAACLADWPGGYCAVRGCAAHGHDCPGDPGQAVSGTGSKCVLAPEATCLKLCAQNSDCRDGYLCATRDDAAGHGSAQVCVPGA